MKYALPKDLVAFSRRAVLRRVLPFCLLEAGMITLIIVLGDRLFGKELHIALQILVYAILILIPFLITGFPLNLRDRTFHGRVVEVSLEHTFRIGFTGSRPPSRGGMMMFGTSEHRVNIMRLTVRPDDGTVIRQTLPPPGHPNPPPAVGAEVFHLYGSNHVITLPTPADDHVCCAVCNGINDPEATVCRQCGRSMVRE